jgi:hypothetical protein
MTILRITFLSLMAVETYPIACTHRFSVDSTRSIRRRLCAGAAPG